MRIESEVYGVFYRDGDKWRGPVDEFVEEAILQEFDSIDDYVKLLSRERKKRVRVFRQVWENDEE